MKFNTKLFATAAAVSAGLFFAGCVDSDFTDPEAVSDSEKAATTTFYDVAGASSDTLETKTGSNAGTCAALDSNPGDVPENMYNAEITVNQISLTSSTVGNNEEICGEFQQIAIASNPNYNNDTGASFKTVISGTITIPSTETASARAVIQRAFAVDFDKGGTDDTVVYGIAFVPASGGIVQIQRAYVDGESGAGSAPSGTSALSVSATDLATAGDYTFEITIEENSSSSTAADVTVKIDGTALTNANPSTDTPTAAIGGTASDTCIDYDTGGCDLKAGNDKPLWSLLSATSVPVNAFNLVLYGNDANSDGKVGIPSIKNLKITN